jgi:hypothetical protein
MSCGDYPQHPMEYWLEFRFVDGVTCYYGDQLGVSVFMLVFFTATFLALYQTSGSIMLPVVVLVVLAPVVTVLLPAIGVQFMVVVLVLMLAIAGFWMYQASGTV